MRINQNIMAFNAYRSLSGTNNMLGKSLEKLSSGYRINRAADDAAGLVISQSLRAQVSALRQATRNAQDGVSVVQTAEGALTEVHSMLNRIRDLLVQAANTASSDADARSAAQNEITQLRSEIDRIAGTTAFGSQALLNGTFGYQAAKLSETSVGGSVTIGATSNTFTITADGSVSATVTLTTGTYATAASWEAEVQSAFDSALATGDVTVTVRELGGGAWQTDVVRNSSASSTQLAVSGLGTGVAVFTASSGTLSNASGGVFQVGANITATNQIAVSITDLRITGGTNGDFSALSGIDATDTTSHASAQSLIDAAITAVSTLRGELGAVQNRFESTISNLQTTTENLTASESRIRDTDMALEMVAFTRNQILLQAGTAMLAQANAAPQTVLRLLQS